MINKEPAKLAAFLIDEYCLTAPANLNIEEIAFAEKLVVKETALKNFEGTINFNEKCGLITINSNIKEPGQRRFTLAHEMGHFFNEKDSLTQPLQKGEEKVMEGYNCAYDDIFSFKVNKKRESDANEFAAELLMHRPWFNDFIKKREINFELVKDLADHFSVSLTAAAFRYVIIGKYPAAIIYSKDGVVKWSAFNDYFPFKFIPKGYPVHKDSAAYDFFAGRTMQTCSDLVPAKVWFPDNFKVKASTYLYEQNTAMPSYNAVLTLLWESEYL